MDDVLKLVSYSGGRKFFIHNVDPQTFKVARLLQLVLKEQDEGNQNPCRIWYEEYGSTWPNCIKPLHTATQFREMIANCRAAGTNWGRVYLQSIEEMIGPDDHVIYKVPFPLNFHRPFEGMENLYDHAAHIQQTVDQVSPYNRKRLEAARIWPYVSMTD